MAPSPAIDEAGWRKRRTAAAWSATVVGAVFLASVLGGITTGMDLLVLPYLATFVLLPFVLAGVVLSEAGAPPAARWLAGVGCLTYAVGQVAVLAIAFPDGDWAYGFRVWGLLGGLGLLTVAACWRRRGPLPLATAAVGAAGLLAAAWPDAHPVIWVYGIGMALIVTSAGLASRPPRHDTTP